MNQLRKQVAEQCKKNIFLSSMDKAYWLEKISHTPLPVLSYLSEVFIDFDLGFRQVLENKLSNDKEGVFWKELNEFKKSQVSKLSKTVHSAESTKAISELEEDLQNIH